MEAIVKTPFKHDGRVIRQGAKIEGILAEIKVLEGYAKEVEPKPVKKSAKPIIELDD